MGSTKLAAHLRAEPTGRLKKLLKLYPGDRQAIRAELARRQALTTSKPTP